MSQKLPTDPTQRGEVLKRATRLTGLLEHPGFKELLAEVDRKIDREQKALGSLVVTPEPVDQRNLDYWRGFFMGLRYLTHVPVNALKVVEQAKTEQETQVMSREENEEWTQTNWPRS